MAEIIFFNGKFVAATEALISVCEPGLLYGWGIFETMRAFEGKIVFLDEHVQRLASSAKKIHLAQPYSHKQWRAIIAEAVRESRLADGYVRISLYKKTDDTVDSVLVVKPYQPYSSRKYSIGFRGCVSRFRRDGAYPLSAIKSTSYMIFRLASQDAARRGYDEAIMLDSQGHIVEGSRTNIFLVKRRRLLSPPLSSGCIDGITRKAVCELAGRQGIEVRQQELGLDDLMNAEEAFLTNSLLGVMPLTRMEKQPVCRAAIGTVTRLLMHAYQHLLQGKGI
jgi:branched-chain amino acid aminotransferase